MTTLHIEHPISDYTTWRAAFDGFERFRAAAGVLAQRVYLHLDDARRVVIQLDFPDEASAASFLDLLRTSIWTNAAASPALRGEPRTVLLELQDEAATTPIASPT